MFPASGDLRVTSSKEWSLRATGLEDAWGHFQLSHRLLLLLQTPQPQNGGWGDVEENLAHLWKEKAEKWDILNRSNMTACLRSQGQTTELLFILVHF